MNSDLSDIGSALTGSLPRNGEAGMTGVLPLAATGFNYSIDPDTGMRRSGANEQMIFCGGVDVVKVTDEGLFDGVTGANLGFAVGVPYVWPFSTAPTGCVFLYGQACTPIYPIIRALLIASGSPYGTTGSDPNFPDYRGVVPAGKSNMGGVDRANLPGGTVLGAALGAATVTLTSNEMPAHTHNVSGNTGTESATHVHNVIATTGNENLQHTHGVSGSTGVESADHTHQSAINNSTGTSTYQAGGGPAVVGLTPAFTTTSGVNVSHTHAVSLVSGTESTLHTHGFNVNSATENATHTHAISFASGSTGSGAAHANLQPSIVQNYIMRVA